MKPKNFLTIYTTCKNLSEAKKISKFLVKEKLVACANIGSPIISIYNWKGKTEESREVPVIFKTTQKQYKAAEKPIRKLHSYDTPCIIAFEIVEGEPNYLSWILSGIRDQVSGVSKF
ncbi:MAG TPA: divalent-cation tolerance protein CutA [Alphaproteobacteria bacterium]|nr:divalent-cation tolerance protein CutA [Alphaproteobacteria bacterium]